MVRKLPAKSGGGIEIMHRRPIILVNMNAFYAIRTLLLLEHILTAASGKNIGVMTDEVHRPRPITLRQFHTYVSIGIKAKQSGTGQV
jgi:hypothetical protein